MLPCTRVREDTAPSGSACVAPCTVRGALGVTLLGAVVPGAGLLWTGRLVGYFLLVPAVGGSVYLLGAFRDWGAAVELATDPEQLRSMSVVLGVGLGVWALSVVATYWCARPAGARRLPSTAGAIVTGLACLAVALPVVQTMRYATVQADLVETLFTENRTATAPRGISEEDPWAGREHVSILLLGGDGSVTREGVRTDSVMLLVLNTRTGRSVMFSLPRNMMYAQFPLDSPLHGLFPEGYTSDGDPASGMLNAVYGQLPARYPGILGDSDNEGADALKQAVAGSLGLDVDYYVLVNLLGFQTGRRRDGRCDRQRQRARGDQRRHRPRHPADRLHRAGPRPAPRRLPRPLVQPRTLGLRRLRADAAPALHGRCAHRRCRPGHARPPLPRPGGDRQGDRAAPTSRGRCSRPSSTWGCRVKEHRVRSIAFVSSDRFFSGDPDFAWMQESVQRALASLDGPRRPRAAGPTADPGEAVDVKDSCAYHPVT